jgi:hypothetical protein
VQTAQSTAQVTLASTDAALASAQSSTQVSLSLMQVGVMSTQAELSAAEQAVCNQPLCGNGTRADSDTCVPHCL